jgi:predicted Zn-dependent protease
MRKLRKKDIANLKKEAEFLTGVARRCPDDLPTLKALADLYTTCGEYGKGLEMDKRLVKLLPEEPLVWYNLACSYALLKQKEEAFTCLERSIELGYKNLAWLSQDDDLLSLRKDPRFTNIVRKLFYQLNPKKS